MTSSKPGPPPVALDVAEVFQAEGPYVVRSLRYFGVPERDVPDVCQEVFVIVHRKLADFEHRAALRTWLFRICQRAASDYRKRAHVRREVSTGEVIDRGQIDGRAVVDGADTRAVLQRALDLLDEDKRTVFVLFEIEGFGMKEVATIVGCPLQTAYSRLHAARRILSEAVVGLREGVA